MFNIDKKHIWTLHVTRKANLMNNLVQQDDWSSLDYKLLIFQPDTAGSFRYCPEYIQITNQWHNFITLQEENLLYTFDMISHDNKELV